MKKITIKQARKAMMDALKKDPDFAQTYKDNIACVIMDHIPVFTKDKGKRDWIANIIFEKMYMEEGN